MKRKYRIKRHSKSSRLLQDAHMDASSMIAFAPHDYFVERENAERKLDALCIAEQLYCMSLGLA